MQLKLPASVWHGIVEFHGAPPGCGVAQLLTRIEVKCWETNTAVSTLEGHISACQAFTGRSNHKLNVLFEIQKKIQQNECPSFSRLAIILKTPGPSLTAYFFFTDVAHLLLRGHLLTTIPARW